MMEWALAILFGAAVMLLILSFYKTRQESKAGQREMEEFSISIMKEVQELQQQMRNFELDAEVQSTEDGKKAGSAKQRLLLREVLDLHKRGYSFEGISAETQLTENEVKLLLAPYMEKKGERRRVANES
ncbi:hypothetical protein ACFFHM_05415 [Halalkalibacter kiskunsagensis]|uniref:Uncharacterized protein n=1 Tax=Halalkalibacter kiskunsagensis TaxID=1548599 RepID=A0ABV6K9K2_9BACI